jgi:succinoglycan biosynthesis protein ExoA
MISEMETTLQVWPKITVVLPIRNEAKFIARTIQYLQEQDYPRDKLEILAVVGDSHDNTAEIVRQIAARDSRVKYLHNPKLWSSSARNIGAKAATGEIITYVDGHTYIDNSQLLKNTARLMAEKDVAVLSRPQFLETPDNTTFQQAVALARRSKLGHGLDSTIYSGADEYVNPASAGATYKREVFDKVGYFDEQFDASEDYEFNYRVAQAGYRAFTSLKLAVYYYPRNSLGALFRQMARYGAGRMRLARKHPDTLGIGTLIPPVFTLGLMVLPLLAIVFSFVWKVFALLYGLYVVAVLLSSFAVALHTSMADLLIFPPIYFVVHTGLGYGFLRESVLGSKRIEPETSP